VLHSFTRDLALSQGEADAPFWQDVYRQAFPTMGYTYVIAKDGWAQRGGVDRVVCLESGKQFHIEQKVRRPVYNDILLEYWSNAEARKPGWIAQDALTDYLAYAFLPTKRCYLFDWATLRRVWLHHRGAWVRAGKRNMDGFRHIVAPNDGYSTVSVAVPIPALLAALQSHILITWKEEAA
jgi:hypothetical protein